VSSTLMIQSEQRDLFPLESGYPPPPYRS
jgi:hypothetical protein